MLKGISPLISPELLKVLDEMGHGDEIVLADANFPSSSIGQRVIRADGIGTAELLAAILPLFPLDQYDPEHFVLMEVVPGDTVVPVIWEAYKALLNYYEQSQREYFLGCVYLCHVREIEAAKVVKRSGTRKRMPSVCREFFLRPSDRRKRGKNGALSRKSSARMRYLWA